MTSNNQRFALPTPEDWKYLIDDLELSSIQANELGILLRHAQADVEAFSDIHPDRADRQELVDALKAFSKALRKLEDVVTGNLPALSDALPHAVGSAIGDMLTQTEIERALGKRLASPLLGEPVQGEIDQGTAVARQSQGITAGPELFVHMLTRIHQPLEAWLKANNANKGGRPKDHVRDYLITKLAENSEAIIGQPPSSRGRFLDLCNAVLGACMFSTDGLRDAVERTLSTRRVKPGGGLPLAKAPQKKPPGP